MNKNKNKVASGRRTTETTSGTLEDGKRHRINQKNYKTIPELGQQHYDMLKASAIADDVIRERGYKTITDPKQLKDLGFSSLQIRVPGLLLPLHSTDGQIPFYIYRPDKPRTDKKHHTKGGKKKFVKYETPSGQTKRLDVPPRCQSKLGDPSITLWITEGQKKADALASVGFCSIALDGVWGFIGKNNRAGKVTLSDFRDIALNNARLVRIVFDSDVMTNLQVKKARSELTEILNKRGAKVEWVNLPGGKEKTGVDDWLAQGHTPEELEGLAEDPRWDLKAAPPVIELLDHAPLIIRRPLCLVDGKAYAAIWPYVLIRTPQKHIDNKGVQLKPEEIREQALHIVRNDGSMFGPAEVEKPLSSLGVEVALPESPAAKDSLWSTPGVKAFRSGHHPDPKDVFDRIKSVIARFIDFDRSLADQETMSEMLACFVIATWFLDAFSVAPYIWANGERGSGKTSLLLILVRLSYLGSSLSPSGSFAALRDLADYGATLGIDDAEDLTDPRKSDPDKRAILLSGNRKGITVPLKEPNPSGQGWKTREVNCYCPRIFSTIQRPDPTLSSRALIIPVVRTAQRSKGNADPLDDMQWPCNRQKLIDDLWAMSLSYLPDMPAFDKLIGDKSKLIGRDLQPWRAILSVAAWLDSMGVSSLWGKIESLAAGTYQVERIDLEKVDINRIAMSALGEFAAKDPTKKEWFFSTQAIVEIMHSMIDEEEIDLDKSIINAQMLGMRFKKMRLPKREYPRPRVWKISLDGLLTMFAAYRIPLPEEIQKLEIPLSGKLEGLEELEELASNPSNYANSSNLENGKNAYVLPKTPCFTCQSISWYVGPSRNILCGVCHPDPRNDNEINAMLPSSHNVKGK